MSLHIAAQHNEIARYVLVCGDPNRVRHIAETYLDNPKLVSSIRGELFYTGEFLGTRLTVGSHGMGNASIAIYAHELYLEYDVKVIIRLGSCGALLPDQRLMDIITVQGAFADNKLDEAMFHKRIPVVAAQPRIIAAIETCEQQLGYSSQKGIVFSQDFFYGTNDSALLKGIVQQHHVIAAEMECYGLFLVAHRCGKEAGAVLTVVNSLVNPQVKALSNTAKVDDLNKMILLGLNTVKHLDNLADNGESS